MNRIQKQRLYNSIMESVAKIVKSSLNEYDDFYNKTSKINDIDLYKFATTTLTDLCAKYFKLAYNKNKDDGAIVKNTKVTSGKTKFDLHTASFTANFCKIIDPHNITDKTKVLCKIYNKEKEDDVLTINYDSISNGYYEYYASIIDGIAYFVHIEDIMKYPKFDKKCVVERNHKFFLNVSVDYFITCAGDLYYKLSPDDLNLYNKQYTKYVVK